MHHRPSGQHAEPAPVLSVDGLSIGARRPEGTLPLVKGVSFACASGVVTALIGESGSGKSLTAAALLGLLDPDIYIVEADAMRLAGLHVAPFASERLAPARGVKVGYIVQDPGTALDPTMTVGDQLGELVEVHRGLSRTAARREAIRLLDMVRIPNAAARAADYPHAFSGGMKQRVVIAGAVALSPDLLLADEPTTALDVTVQAEILTLIDDLRRSMGMAVLLITHDLGIVYQVADRVLVMYAGRIVEEADADTVCAAPRHPYTAGLLASVPDLSRSGRATAAIPGSPPRPGFDESCAFAPRCAHAQAACRQDRPHRRAVGPSTVSCHFPLESNG
jgi:oligopeptide/dipeptide ABC transporter ATP-binding protein